MPLVSGCSNRLLVSRASFNVLVVPTKRVRLETGNRFLLWRLECGHWPMGRGAEAPTTHPAGQPPPATERHLPWRLAAVRYNNNQNVHCVQQ